MTYPRLRFLLTLLALPACAGGTHPGAHTTPTGPVLVQAVDPNLVHLTADTSATLVTAGKPGRLAVRLRITADDLPHGDRWPLNLALVIDTSGSMEGDAIAAARTAALAVVDRMRDGDRLAVITFGSTAEVLVPGTPLDASVRATVKRKIAAMTARGTTDMSSGLGRGLAELQGGLGAKVLSRLVLLSDGVPNDPTTIPAVVEQARSWQIPIAALGLGLDFDENLLGQIAMETGGPYRYVSSPEMVAEVFDHELLRLERLVARNLIVTLTAGPCVTIEEIPGFTMSGAGGLRSATIGDLAAGETRDLIVPLTIGAHRDGATVELLDAALSFEDVIGQSGSQKRDAFVAVHASADAAQVAASVVTEIDLALERARAAGAILQAIAVARAGQPDAARDLLLAAEKQARTAAARHKDDELTRLADQMRALLPNLPAMAAAAIGPPPTTQAMNDGAGAAEPDSDAPMPAPASVKEAHESATDVLRGGY